MLSVSTSFHNFAQSLIVWSCHASCTLPSAGLKENKVEMYKFNINCSWKMVFFPLNPSPHRLAEKREPCLRLWRAQPLALSRRLNGVNGEASNLTKGCLAACILCLILVPRRQSSGLQRAGTHPAKGFSSGPNKATVAQWPHVKGADSSTSELGQMVAPCRCL